MRQVQQRVCRAIDAAAAAGQRERQKLRRTGSRQGTAAATARAERQAAAAVAAGVAVGQAWATITAALQLFTPTGESNTRGRAEGIIAAALALLDDAVWAKTRRALDAAAVADVPGPHAQATGGLVAAGGGAGRRGAGGRSAAASRGMRAASPSAVAFAGVLLAAGLVLGLSGAEGAEVVAQVRRVLGQAWRASSLVECLNGVARMQQSRHRRMTAGLLALKRLYWNCRTFRTGRRRQQTPYGVLGIPLPTTDWCEFLRLTPEQLRQQLSAPGGAA